MEVDSTRPTADLDRADTTERPETDHDVASLSDERSVAASQTSTLDTATSSQMHAHPDSKESSQSSLDHYDGDSTPMDLDAPKMNGTRPNGVASGASPLHPIDTDVATAKVVNGAVNGHLTDLKHGQKRTASGTVKDQRPQSATGADAGLPVSHKRNASANTQINELSAQLRARMSYAMLKVQNGWETRTLEEVEALAAQQQGSPMSTSSPWRGSGSPNVSGASPSTSGQYPAATTHASNALNGSLNADYTSRTSSTPNHSASLSGSFIPPLAPPVEFGANANPRRTTGYDRLPPQLTNGNSTNKENFTVSSMGSARSGTLIPATPPLDDTPSTMQTPSQRATASERDAIETLLFMSSPGNSQAFRNSTPQVRPLSQSVHQSPQKPTLSASPHRNRPSSAKQVSFLPVSAAATHAVDRVPLSPRKKGILDNANLETDAGIDRVLDQMPVDGDGESSSDESLGSVEARSEGARPPVSV